MDYIIGFHGILEALRATPGQVKLLVAEEGGGSGSRRGPRVREILEAAAKAKVPVEVVDQALLARIDPANKGVALALLGPRRGLVSSLDEFLETAPERALVLILDHLEDPQNLGAVLRSADVFGASLVIAPTRRASPLGDAAFTASAGAAAWVPLVFAGNLADSVRRLKKAGFWIYAADMGGEPLPNFSLEPLSCFVLGNEGAGLSRLLLENADQRLSIPMLGHVDSLNVSVAAALCMYEYRRRFPG